MSLTARYALSLGIALAIELPTAAHLAGPGRRRRAALDALFLNLLTHPLASLAYWHGAPFVALEMAVAAVEGCGYRLVTGLEWRRALALGLVANAVSALPSAAL